MAEPAPPGRFVSVLLGPTASGKTAVSLPLAERLGAEVLCLDSRQVFRGMAIGTAQPTEEEQSRVPHHLFGVIEPGARFSAGDYGRLARACLARVEARGAAALFVGGAGLYLRALEGGLAAGLPADPVVRERLRQRIARQGSAALHAELVRHDPEVGSRLHPNDAQRITRALEVIELTGRRVSELQRGAAETSDLASRLRIVVLNRPRASLYARIEARSRELLAGGMVAEVRRQLEAGLDPNLPVFRAHGYPEIAAWLAGSLSWDAMEARLNQVTRNYVKRQLTWFRKLPGAAWLEVPDGEDPERTAENAALLFAVALPAPDGAGAGPSFTQDLT